jgi:putative flippase GtrA
MPLGAGQLKISSWMRPSMIAEVPPPPTGIERLLLAGDIRRFMRFALVGAVNTAITGALLVLIASWVAIDIAYTIVYAIGLAFTATVTSRFVFERRPTVRTTTRFLGWYLAVYLLGVAVVHTASGQLHSSHLLATLAVLAVTVPLNFLGGRRIFGTGVPTQP